MNKFLKLLLILAITPIILATTGFVVLPSSVFAYIKDGKEVFIGSYMIFTFAIANTVLSFFGITYLRRVKKKFNDENYPMEIPFFAIRLVFTLIAILTVMYGIYLRQAKKDNEFAIRNKWTLTNDIVFTLVNKFSGVVFIAGGVFISIVTWIITNQNQLYITTMFTLGICALSSNYISRTVGMRYKMMYKEKK